MYASVVLPRPGGRTEQHVVERLSALPGRGDVDAQVVLVFFLADEFGERARSGDAVEVFVVALLLSREQARHARFRSLGGVGRWPALLGHGGGL